MRAPNVVPSEMSKVKCPHLQLLVALAKPGSVSPIRAGVPAPGEGGLLWPGHAGLPAAAGARGGMPGRQGKSWCDSCLGASKV